MDNNNLNDFLSISEDEIAVKVNERNSPTFETVKPFQAVSIKELVSKIKLTEKEIEKIEKELKRPLTNLEIEEKEKEKRKNIEKDIKRSKHLTIRQAKKTDNGWSKKITILKMAKQENVFMFMLYDNSNDEENAYVIKTDNLNVRIEIAGSNYVLLPLLKNLVKKGIVENPLKQQLKELCLSNGYTIDDLK